MFTASGARPDGSVSRHHPGRSRHLYDGLRFDGALSKPRTRVRGRPANCVAGSDQARCRFVSSGLNRVVRRRIEGLARLRQRCQRR